MTASLQASLGQAATAGNIILALDLGSTTGWALAQAGGAIASGSVVFRPGRFEGAGMAFVRFRGWLARLHADAGALSQVVFEEVRGPACDRTRERKGWARWPPRSTAASSPI